jgi:hypothetical protein
MVEVSLMSKSIFIKDPEHYLRDIEPIKHYINQSARYLQLQTGDSIEQCREFIVNQLQTGDYKDPVVQFFHRQDNGDRVTDYLPLSRYISSVVANQELIVPSFTCYLAADQVASQLSDFVAMNLKQRSVAKKEAFKHKASGNLEMFAIKNNEQTNRKLYNNSLSGAFATMGSALYNPTSHSTLTSVTRTITSFGNAINERMVAGNRHYRNPDIVIYNIVSIITNTDYDKLQIIMDKYQLHYPSVDEVLECIEYSTKHYWCDKNHELRINELINKLTPIQRASFIYTGDFYHLRKHNQVLVKTLLANLSKKVNLSIEDPLARVNDFNESELSLAQQICSEEIRGLGSDFKLMQEKNVLNILVSTANNVREVFNQYKDLIECLFLSDNLPPSIAYIRSMVRRVVVLSDTDSTCATYQEWVQWYRGKLIIDPESLAIAASVMTIATQTVANALAILSANIGVARDKLYSLAMKNEFTWDVFCPTNVSKHYFANTIVQEGNIFAQSELEKKGVHLINRNGSVKLVTRAHQMMQDIIESIRLDGQISIGKYLKLVADTEREIQTSLLDGKIEYYRKLMIKDASSYKKEEEQSPYLHYLLWRSVFELKYGTINQPPYSAIKIPTILNNKTKLAVWLSNMSDTELARRMTDWLKYYKKTSLPTIYLPAEFLAGNGMINEIIPIIDSKRVILDLCNVYYILLETLGYIKKPGYLLCELGY